jgi:uncharacterized membrane protein
MELARELTLLAATITVGLVAGVFFAYAVAVMPGLGETDDRTFVGAFQAMDRAIINPVFMAAFVGALAITGVTGALHLAEEARDVLPWIVVAFVLYLVVFIVTVGINVPLNDAIKAAGRPDNIDVAAVRARFHEARWAGWNIVRTVLTTASSSCLAWALIVNGRLDM